MSMHYYIDSHTPYHEYAYYIPMHCLPLSHVSTLWLCPLHLVGYVAHCIIFMDFFGTNKSKGET